MPVVEMVFRKKIAHKDLKKVLANIPENTEIRRLGDLTSFVFDDAGLNQNDKDKLKTAAAKFGLEFESERSA